MSSIYTKWIHDGESLGIDIIESSDVHESHHDDWIAMEEDGNDNTLIDINFVGDLFRATYRVGKKAKV
jgi:hypothetical protein